MLPGFRFLFAAIVMCMSVLVFGLGAAALFRAAHDDFASNPTWRAPPEPRFAQQDDPTKTVLAVLSVQPAAIEPAEQGADAATAGPAGAEPSPESPAPEPPATAAPSPTELLTPSEAAKSGMSAPEGVRAAQPSAQMADASPGTPADADALAPESDDKVAVVEDKPAGEAPSSASAPALSAAQPTPEPVAAPATPQSTEAATRIATLGGPPVMTDEIAAARASDPKLDRNEVNKRLRAEHAREQRRRRLAALRRARLAQQAAASLLFTQNPFTPHPLVGPPPTPAR